MKAYLLLDEELKDNFIKRIGSIELNSIIILTDKQLYSKVIITYPNLKFIFIDLFSDRDSDKKSNLAVDIMNELLATNPLLAWREYNLPEILINQVYDSMIKIIYNLINELDKTIKEYSVTTLCLFGGNPRVQFLPLTLAEGERAFRFLYKRTWFLNYFANQAFKEKLTVEFKNKTPMVFLKVIRSIRPMAIILGKLISTLKRIIKKKGSSRNNVKNFDVKKEIALIMVRNPIQVEPLIPMYNEIERDNEFIPLYLAYENYSNNKLVNELNKRNLRYLDLYEILNMQIWLSSIKSIIKIKKGNKNIFLDKVINESRIFFSVKEISVNLLPFIIDIIITEKLLTDFSESVQNKICCLINNETHSYHSGIQGEWIKKRNCASFGIQHVTISNKLLPKISRVSTMFMMSKEITKQLSEIKPDEDFIFLGPMSYDLHFNTSEHTDEFKRISIFTQPDDFKKEYLKIIQDIVDIIKENNLRVEFNIKLHPRERDLDSFKNFEINNPNVKVISNEITSNELIKTSDLVVSIHSGILMQSIIIGTPGISINYDKRHEIKLDFINHNVTQKVQTKDELQSSLLDFNRLNEMYYINRDSFLKSYLEDYKGNAANGVYKYIKQEVFGYNEKRSF